jgi:TPR repeat protein
MNRKVMTTVLIAMTIGVSYMSYGGFSLTDALDIKDKRFDLGKKHKEAKKDKVDAARPTNPQGNSTRGKQARKQEKGGDGNPSSESPATDKQVQEPNPKTNDKTCSASQKTDAQVRQERIKRMKEGSVNEDKQPSPTTTVVASEKMPTPKFEDRPTYTAELQQKAESGDAAAQLDLALCYDCGYGVEKNPVEAHKWFLKAAEQGNGRAQNAVGNDYANGTGGVEKNLEEALRWYRKSAEQECGYGQNSMGWCYEWGKGVEKDMEEAVKWYRKSAEQGCANGQISFGNCYLNGKGVEKNMAEAVKWYRKSAEQGNPRGQFLLGAFYLQGVGVEKDMVEGVKWLRASAEQGNCFAQNCIGALYQEGTGVEKNLSEAVKWYRKSAEQGGAEGQCSLGSCYFYGIGVEKNFVEAVKWYRKSAEQGNSEGQWRLGLCYQRGNGVKKDLVEAVKWYRKSAEKGDAMGQALLGDCYFKGYGVKGDMDEAFKWLSKSAKQGNEIAKDFLAKPEFSMVRVARGSAEDIEAGEACLQKLKEFKKDGRFSVEAPAPKDILVIKGLYIGMPIDDALVACGKIAASSNDFLVADSRMIETEAWANCKAFKSLMKNFNGVCVLSCRGIDNIQDAKKLCVVRPDGEGKVRQIFFTRLGIDDIFKSSDLSTEEFAKALQDNYPKIASLAKTVEDKRKNEADMREYRWRCIAGGCNVELYENTVVVDGEEIDLRKYKSVMANDPNAFGVALGEGLFSKYFCIDVKAKKSNGSFD